MSTIKKILISGASGMVGKNLTDRLHIDYEILRPSSSELNLLDLNIVTKYLEENKPDLIIHCAGKVGGIQANISEPTEFLYENTMMGFNLVKAAQNIGIKKFLNLGSSCMYPRNAKNPLKEELVLKGELEPTNEGYAIAKCAVARLCEYISRQYPEFAYKTIIPCNLYGKYDKFSEKNSHMIPAVIKKIDNAINNNLPEVEIWGDGLARREFMYSEDLAEFVFMAINNYEKLPVLINAGLGYDYTINEYYATIANVLGYSGKFTHDLTKPSGMMQKLVDVTKQTEFGFKPKFSLEEGVRRTYEYYKSTI